MSLSSFRSLLYQGGKALGHVQAIKKAADTRSVEPLVDRAFNVEYGKASSRLRSWLRGK